MKKKSPVKGILILLAAVLAVVGIVLLIQNLNSTEVSYSQYVVQTGDISDSVKRTGLLTADDPVKLSAPSGVTVDQVLVKLYDSVEAGDPLASLDTKALADARETALQAVRSAERQLAALDAERTTTQLKAPFSGRVKAINKSDVSDKRLFLLSLDGRMRLVFSSDASFDTKDGSIRIEDAEGNSYEATVIAREGADYVLSVSDQEAMQDTEFTVKADGEAVGSGTLAVSAPYWVEGELSNVDSFEVKVNDEVTKDQLLAELQARVQEQDYAEALKAYDKAQAELGKLDRLLADPWIYSGVSGMVTALYMEDHSLLAGSAEQLTVAQVAPSALHSFTASIPESVIAELYVGKEATVILTAFPDESLEAAVEEIDPIGSNSSGSTSYSVRFGIEAQDKYLLSMSGTVEFVSESAEDTVILPMELLLEGNAGTYYVLVPDETGSAVQQSVTVGISNDSYAQITQGLSAGDVVLYTGTLSTEG